jgi:hypothetical protein
VIVYPSNVRAAHGTWEGASLIMPVAKPLVRNRRLASVVQVLIACPKQEHEVMGRAGGGTWATVRYARQERRKIIVIPPSGVVREECN